MAAGVVAGRFQLEEKVGEGAMGVVWRARDLRDGSTVAVKLLAPASSKEVRDRFFREARLLAALEHASIVRYVDSGPAGEGEVDFLAMEWLAGEDLEARLRQSISPRESLRILATAAEALGAAHQRGVVHRDVKPSNVFVGHDGTVKMLDFGVARVAEATHALTRADTLLGTPGYMAPEQIRADPVDARADVFALGCILFEALTGRPAFFAEQPVALLFKILIEEPPAPSELARGIPPALDALVADCLSKDPARRPADGNAFAERAKELLSQVDEIVRFSTARTDRPVSLTGGEQRVVCIVVVSGDVNLESAKTLHADTAAAEVRAIASIAADYGGRVEALPSGARVIAFGAGRGIREQAESAARCALAVSRAIPRSGIALAMGLAEVSSTRLPVGEVLDRAVKLVESAAPGTVRADDVAITLLDTRFHSAERVLTGEREQASSIRTLLGKPTPFVGRNQEIVGLEAIVNQAVSDGEARAALVVGAPGIGKSRLRDELVRRLGVTVWSAKASVAAPFSVIRDLVRNAAGIGDREPVPDRARKLRGFVDTVAPRDVARVAQFLGELTGISLGEASVQLRAARHDAIRMGDQIRHAVDDLFDAACEAPLVIVIDDLQWADVASVQLLDRQLRTHRDKPLVVIGFARPEVDTVLDGAWEEHGLVRMALGGLSKKAAAQLVKAVLPDTDKVDALVGRADGNAFLLEELVREAAQGRFESMPLTVLAMVQARFESLPADARRVLRAASIYGNVFTRDAVIPLMREMTPEGVDAALAVLEERELVARTDDGKLQFRQPLVRDAAYGTLTDTDKMLGHRLAGRYLRESHSGASAREIAMHLDRGNDVEGAVPMLVRAAEECLAGNDWAGVEAIAARLETLGASGLDLGAILAIRAEASAWSGRDLDAERFGKQALEHLVAGSRRWLEAVRWAGEAAARVGHLDELDALAVRVKTTLPLEGEAEPWAATTARFARHLFLTGNRSRGEELLAAAEKEAGPLDHAYPLVRAPIHSARAMRAMLVPDISETVRERELSAQHFELAGEMRSACVEYINLAEEWIENGMLEQGESVLRIALEAADRMGMPSMVAFARMTLAEALMARDDIAGAARLFRETAASFEAGGHSRLEGVSRARLALLLDRHGDRTGALREAEIARTKLDAAPLLRGLALAVLAQLELSNPARALELAEQAHDSAKQGSEGDEAFVMLVLARALRANGRNDEAKRVLESALAAIETRAKTITDPQLRESFLSRGKDHAALRAELQPSSTPKS